MIIPEFRLTWGKIFENIILIQLDMGESFSRKFLNSDRHCESFQHQSGHLLKQVISLIKI